MHQHFDWEFQKISKYSNEKAELWKIRAKERLRYFSDKTAQGEIPLDLLVPKSERIDIL